MAQKRRTPEQLIGKLSEAEEVLAAGQTIEQACRKIGVSEQALRLSSGQALLSVAPGVRRPESGPGEEAEGAGDRKRQVEKGGCRPNVG